VHEEESDERALVVAMMRATAALKTPKSSFCGVGEKAVPMRSAIQTAK
jgi:hypothetical protein